LRARIESFALSLSHRLAGRKKEVILGGFALDPNIRREGKAYKLISFFSYNYVYLISFYTSSLDP